MFDFEISSRNWLNFEIVEICKLDLTRRICVFWKFTTIYYDRCVFGWQGTGAALENN